MQHRILLSLTLLAPLFAGCLAEDAPPAAADAVAASAQDAGAVQGPAPAAAKDAYTVRTTTDEAAPTVTVHPARIETNAAKMPYTDTFEGVFSPQDCSPTGSGLPVGGFGLASPRRAFNVTDAFAKDDVFSYDVSLAWTNTDQSWGDLHLWHRFDGVSNTWTEFTGDKRGEVVLNFTGQGFIVSEDFLAFVGVACWYGAVTQPIPFTITLSVVFAEGAVPSDVPVLLRVPEGATKLFATGVALDPDAPVLSHYRVFGPDDELVCECALNSDETVDVLELDVPGDYVVLVDHTANGFLSLGLDAPVEPLVPLDSQFAMYPLFASDGSTAVAETIMLDIPSTPLRLWAWVFAPGSIQDPPNVGAGHNLKISVTNGRGEVLRTSMVGYATYHAAVPGVLMTNDWYAVPLDGEWEFFVDHHAYDLGAHTVQLTADQMRGEARLFALHYLRP